ESIEPVDNNENDYTFLPRDKIAQIKKIFTENENKRRIFIIAERIGNVFKILDFIFDEEDDSAVREKVLTRSNDLIYYSEIDGYEYIPSLAKKITKKEEYEDEELNEVREDGNGLRMLLEYILWLLFLNYLEEEKQRIYYEIEKELRNSNRTCLLGDDDTQQSHETEYVR
ncbi:MAG: hypothetical protein K2G03_00185, partial [Bacilli bacterium]|nr:hypothetical protein [Bacilli bacterium]